MTDVSPKVSHGYTYVAILSTCRFPWGDVIIYDTVITSSKSKSRYSDFCNMVSERYIVVVVIDISVAKHSDKHLLVNPEKTIFIVV